MKVVLKDIFSECRTESSKVLKLSFLQSIFFWGFFTYFDLIFWAILAALWKLFYNSWRFDNLEVVFYETLFKLFFLCDLLGILFLVTFLVKQLKFCGDRILRLWTLVVFLLIMGVWGLLGFTSRILSQINFFSFSSQEDE